MNLTTTPSVKYTYDDGAAGTGVAAYLRLSQITYPNSTTSGRTVNYNYPAGVDSIMSLLGSITDSTGTLAAYTYLGSGTIVKEDYPQAAVKLNYDPGANNTYSDLDRFGRVLDQVGPATARAIPARWTATATPTTARATAPAKATSTRARHAGVERSLQLRCAGPLDLVDFRRRSSSRRGTSTRWATT